MSGVRCFLIEQRYLPISVEIEYSDIEAPVEAFAAYILDITLRPIFAFHLASLWVGPFHCLHFTVLITSFQSFSPNSDILETDEGCVSPSLDTQALRIWRLGFGETSFPAGSC